MKKILIMATLIFTSITVVGAPLNKFKGTWNNTNSLTGSITKMKIRVISSDDIRVKTLAKCSPNDCNWGIRQAIAYGNSASSNLNANTKSMTTVYNQGFVKRTLLMTLVNNNRLSVKVFTEFLDNSGRTNYTSKLTFKKNSPAPGFIHFSSVGSKKINKIVYLPYTFSLNSYGTMKALRLSVADASINIQSAVIVYQNGTHRSLDLLLGHLQNGSTKQVVFNPSHVKRVIITAASPNPIGSRGNLFVEAGMPQ